MNFVIQKIDLDANNKTVYLQDAFMCDTDDEVEVERLANAIWGSTNYMGFVIKKAVGLVD